jgi:hypothetical protein
MTGNLLNRARHIAALFGVLLLPIHPALAEPVEAKLPNGIIATADFRTGQPARPAVLLLHGFLQTRHSPPMSSLANTLADQGYTVLTPTLTLGINRRAKSLACEAVHTHDLESDVGEIGFWVDWLTGKGLSCPDRPSSGAADLDIWQVPSHSMRTILTSLIPFISDRSSASTLDLLRKTGCRKGLARYTLAYCRKAMPPAPRLPVCHRRCRPVLATWARSVYRSKSSSARPTPLWMPAGRKHAAAACRSRSLRKPAISSMARELIDRQGRALKVCQENGPCLTQVDTFLAFHDQGHAGFLLMSLVLAPWDGRVPASAIRADAQKRNQQAARENAVVPRLA